MDIPVVYVMRLPDGKLHLHHVRDKSLELVDVQRGYAEYPEGKAAFDRLPWVELTLDRKCRRA